MDRCAYAVSMSLAEISDLLSRAESTEAWVASLPNMSFTNESMMAMADVEIAVPFCFFLRTVPGGNVSCVTPRPEGERLGWDTISALRAAPYLCRCVKRRDLSGV